MSKLLNMTESSALTAIVRQGEESEEYDISDCCDMTSTSGYDNDGSTGPELLDNGVSLAFAARDYDPQAVIFFAYGNDVCYYQYGKDEADAVRRLTYAIGKAG